LGSARTSIQLYARLGGALFLLSIVAGGFGEAVAPTQLTVTGDAAATAHNIVSSSFLFRAGFASYLVEAVCDTALTAILYILLRPVNAGLALFAVFFRLMATATFAFAELFYFLPSLVLGGDAYLKSFTPDQLNALALLSLNTYALGGGVFLVFYGIGSLLIGYLIYRLGYLPQWLGVLWALGGLAFVLRTFALVLAPGFQSAFLQLPTILAIFPLALWLLIKGVDVTKWGLVTAQAPDSL
jgi:Domain of unknown function (DUF4386)